MTAQQRFMTMVVVDAMCVMIAIAALVGDLSLHLTFGLPAFAAALIVGFAAQIWFIAGLAKDGRLGKGV
ncbi:MAG TPA: hypothetical protein VMU59_02805 [Caulobacteraceae bacterium]|nr:hypothetical protein [Caulobacteraceae bacterium]